VLEILRRPGEAADSGGVLTLGNLSAMIVTLEIYQSAIGRVAEGQPVSVAAEALPEPLHGTVERIGLSVRRQELVAADPAANTDARVVEVTVALDPASSARARRLTNLQVVGRIEMEGGT
jgi:HlyD family secretion protein